MWKKFCSCFLAFLCFSLLAALSEGSDAASLRQMLRESSGAEPGAFFCADYDGDGAQEAFAFVGTVDDSWGYDAYNGDIWFVNANDIINVNLDRGSSNANLSLRYDETSVSYWEEDSGVYLPASDPSIAIYPAGFKHPTGTGSAPDAAASLLAPQRSAGLSEPSGGYSCEYDLDGDGTAENILLYKVSSLNESGYEMTHIRLRVTRADGNVWADGEIYSFQGRPRAEQRFLIYNLGTDRIYIQAQFRFEGDSNNYELFRMEDGALIEEINLCDPDPSDDCVLYDESIPERTSRSIYSSESHLDKAGPDYLAVMNQRFAAYNITFSATDHVAYANLPDSQLICEVAALQIDTNDFSPQEYPASTNDTAENGAADFDGEAYNSNKTEQVDVYVTYGYTTGDVKMREGPSLNDGTVTIVPGGSTVGYLGEEAVDERGVAWYRVSYCGMEGWCSSKYVDLQ